MDINDIFNTLFYNSSLKITEAEELDEFRMLLEFNFMENGMLLSSTDYLDNMLKDTIFEDATNDDFNENIIRKAIELGYYPMAINKRVLKTSELSKKEFNEFFDNDKKIDRDIFRSVLTIKYHSEKLIVPFEKFRTTKKLKGWLKGKFSDYVLTFNRDYDGCIKELLAAYPETWLLDDLLEKYKTIHENPDEKISIDSVEIWHDGKLVAGEIGFTTHNAYASLSGFHKEKDSGTLQMCVLGLFLKSRGYAYWDLGMKLDYKYRYGAISCDRDEQEKFYSTLSKGKLSFPKEEIPMKNFLDLI